MACCLGAEPTPLMHGDKVEIAGVELRFADDAKGGATQFVSASDIAAMQGAKRAGSARPTAASGGRLVSLVDGKEYTVPTSGLVFGRDASCDVVVPQNEVSRRHAEIAPGEQGYVVRDTSANGVFVNGDRVQGSQRLARSDVRAHRQRGVPLLCGRACRLAHSGRFAAGRCRERRARERDGGSGA